MALAQDLRYYNNLVTSTKDAVRPMLVDQIYNSNALLARLYKKDKIVLQGGNEIQIPIIYDQENGDWYSRLEPFSTSMKETFTMMRFDWKSVYTEITLPGIDVFMNSGPGKAFDLVNAKLTNARMTLSNKLGTALYNAGTDANQLTGLLLALAATGTYGKMARSASPGTVIAGNVDTTGGAINVATINSLMGTASRGHAEKPDLIITTPTLWDALWARVQPQQRFSAKDGPSADVGFDYINISGAAVVADSKCPAGYVLGLNTNYIEFYVGEGYDFYLRGPFELQNKDGFTFQILMYCELAVSAPNLCFMASGLSAS